MKLQTTDTTQPPQSTDLGRRKTLEELIAEQGVAQTATFERLLGAGAELWDDDREFGQFLDAVQAVRQEKGEAVAVRLLDTNIVSFVMKGHSLTFLGIFPGPGARAAAGRRPTARQEMPGHIGVDGAGHEFGFHPKEAKYLEAIAKVDALIGELLKALQGRKAYEREDWLIVVSTDHGGSGKGHGQNTPEHRTIFLIVSGQSALRGTIEPAPTVMDIVPTVLSHMGVAIDPAWKLDGKAVGLKTAP